MFDIEKIQKHLIELLKDLENLEKYKDVNTEQLKNDLDLLWILERGIYLAIQNLFDILAHIAAAEFNEKWESYSDIAEIMLNKTVIKNAQYETLIKMAGFRNRLSHDYLSLDNDIIVDIVTNRLDDFYSIINLIKNYLKL